LFLSKIGTVFVERFDTSASIKDADQTVEAIKNGRSIVYFPEGTFTRMPGLHRFKWALLSLPSKQACRSSPSF